MISVVLESEAAFGGKFGDRSVEPSFDGGAVGRIGVGVVVERPSRRCSPLGMVILGRFVDETRTNAQIVAVLGGERIDALAEMGSAERGEHQSNFASFDRRGATVAVVVAAKTAIVLEVAPAVAEEFLKGYSED